MLTGMHKLGVQLRTRRCAVVLGDPFHERGDLHEIGPGRGHHDNFQNLHCRFTSRARWELARRAGAPSPLLSAAPGTFDSDNVLDMIDYILECSARLAIDCFALLSALQLNFALYFLHG